MIDSPRRNESIVTETTRLTQRYIDDVVLAFNLCPWAAPALVAGKVEIAVISASFVWPQDGARLAAEVRQRLTRVAPSAELTLVVMPCLSCSRLEMDELLRKVRTQEGSGEEQDRELDFALAGFHPDAPLDGSSPERLIPYLRRSADPLIQGVRRSVLDKIDTGRGSGTAFFDPETMSLGELAAGQEKKSLRLKIAQQNHQFLDGGHFPQLARAYDALMLDHAQTWERLRRG